MSHTCQKVCVCVSAVGDEIYELYGGADGGVGSGVDWLDVSCGADRKWESGGDGEDSGCAPIKRRMPVCMKVCINTHL